MTTTSTKEQWLAVMVEEAAGLLEGGDGVNLEYERALCELIARCGYCKEGEATPEAAMRAAEEIGARAMLSTPIAGTTKWFEYHCHEGLDSIDRDLWLRSHRQVRVVRVAEAGYGVTPLQRAENGQPRIYSLQWEDGYEGDAFEDEIMDSPEAFERPDPPAFPS